jgi:NRPS condensation-like uncharacterized protein
VEELPGIDAKSKTALHRIHNKIFKPTDRIRASSLDTVMYYTHLYHDGQCRCVIRFEGRIDISKLTRAVELSLKIVPILSYRFVYHPWKCYWEKGSLSNTGIPFRYLETQSAEKETCKFLAEPINTKQGVQVSVSLIRSEYDTLCIKLSHMVADAMGLLDYICILRNLYNKLQCNPDFIPQKAPECPRGISRILRQVGIPVLTKGFSNWDYPKSDWGFPQVNSDFSSGAFPVRLIGKERLNSIRTFCHEKGVKFTDVITAAFYQALIDILKPRPNSQLSIQMTMDLRSYLPSGKAGTICNMTGTYYPVIRYSDGKSFDQTLRDVIKVISAAREGKSWFGGVVFVEMISIFPGFIHTLLARKVAKREFSNGTSHPFFSNLGVIDRSMIDFGDLKAEDLGLFGPVSFPPNFLATVYTFNEKMYINSSFCPTATDPKLVDRFFDCFLTYLPA